jgi:AcrR family transcriptional regulator
VGDRVIPYAGVVSTREKIVEACLKLVRTYGYKSLSVRSVATEAGVGASTLRHYFPTQADLHREVAHEVVLGRLPDLAIADDSVRPADRLYDCLVEFLPSEDPAERSAMLLNWFELYQLTMPPDPAPAFRGVLESAHQASDAVLRRWLTILAGQGHLDEADVDVQAAHFLALINGFHLSMLVEPERFDLDLERRILRADVERLFP